MTSYTVTADNEQDAIDIAKRRAADDGLTVMGIGRRFTGVMPGTWTVYLRVSAAR